MTQEDTKKLLSTIRATYPKYFSNMSKEESINMLLVWSDVLSEDDPITIMLALKSYIRQSTNGFPPSPGQIIDIAHTISNPILLDADTAWNLVYKAVCNSIYHASEEFKNLPPEVQAGVGSPNQLRAWATTDTTTLGTVVASVFKKNYSSRVKEKIEFDKLPNQAKNLIGELTNAKKLSNEDELIL